MKTARFYIIIHEVLVACPEYPTAELLASTKKSSDASSLLRGLAIDIR